MLLEVKGCLTESVVSEDVKIKKEESHDPLLILLYKSDGRHDKTISTEM